MKRLRNTAVIWASVGILLLSGCVLKKKRPPLPQQAQVPTITAPIPEQIPEETSTLPPLPPAPPPPQQAEKSKPKRHHFGKKTPAQAQSPAAPEKPARVVIQESGNSPSQGQLTASLDPQTAANQQQSTAQLLDATQNNLNSIKRQLSAEEQAMVNQIKDYMTQARKASTESDPVRAHNLALKARLLSDELVRR